jgi:hypothetical protein
MFQDGLFAFLTTQSSLTVLLGTSRRDKTTGVFPSLTPAEATLPFITTMRPFITTMRLSGSNPATLQGANALQTGRFRFSCYGASQRQAGQVAKAIKDIFASWTGTLPDGTVVQQVMYEFESDDMETVPHGTVFACHVDFSFMWVDNGA